MSTPRLSGGHSSSSRFQIHQFGAVLSNFNTSVRKQLYLYSITLWKLGPERLQYCPTWQFHTPNAHIITLLLRTYWSQSYQIHLGAWLYGSLRQLQFFNPSFISYHSIFHACSFLTMVYISWWGSSFKSTLDSLPSRWVSSWFLKSYQRPKHRVSAHVH